MLVSDACQTVQTAVSTDRGARLRQYKIPFQGTGQQAAFACSHFRLFKTNGLIPIGPLAALRDITRAGERPGAAVQDAGVWETGDYDR